MSLKSHCKLVGNSSSDGQGVWRFLRIPVFCLIGLIVLVTCAAAKGQILTRNHEITIDDYFSLGFIRDLAVSPDGKQVVYSELCWQTPDKGRSSDLWLVELSTKSVRRLTFDSASKEAIRWSSDNRSIFFMKSQSEEGRQSPPYNNSRRVWRLIVATGQCTPVTRVADDIGLYDLSKDNRFLYYTINVEKAAGDWRVLRSRYHSLHYGHGLQPAYEVWRLDLDSRKAVKLTEHSGHPSGMTLSPDQSCIALIVAPDGQLIHNEGWSRIELYYLVTKKHIQLTRKKWRRNHPSPYGWINEVVWSPDSHALAFSVSFDGYPTLLYMVHKLGPEPRLVALPVPADISVTGGTLQWRPPNRELCFIAEKHARAQIYTMTGPREGRKSVVEPLTAGNWVIEAFDVSAGKDAEVALASGITHPPDLFRIRRHVSPERLTCVNPQVDSWNLPQISKIQWTGPDGDVVEGMLELPPDYRPNDGLLPMVLVIHGGPTLAEQFKLRFSIYGRILLASRGYAVLIPNYRGSTGYGERFQTGLIGHMNDVDCKDIMAGVDALVNKRTADAGRLGVMGWSSGGYLTLCLLTQTDRFKAASCGAGIVDLTLQWGAMDSPGWVLNLSDGAFPWSAPKQYLSTSPIYRLDRVRTPLLIHAGEEDHRVLTTHSLMLYRGLHYYLNVPVELILYPGEGHSLMTYKSRRAKLEWDLAWFDHYLKRQVKP